MLSRLYGVSGLLLLTPIFYVLNDSLGKIRIYVGTDGKLHYVDKAGADTALNFSSAKRFTEAYKYSVHTNSLNYEYTVPSGITQAIVLTNYPTSSIVPNITVPTNFYLSISDPWGQSILFYEVKEGDRLSFNATGSQVYNVILAIYVA